MAASGPGTKRPPRDLGVTASPGSSFSTSTALRYSALQSYRLPRVRSKRPTLRSFCREWMREQSNRAQSCESSALDGPWGDPPGDGGQGCGCHLPEQL